VFLFNRSEVGGAAVVAVVAVVAEAAKFQIQIGMQVIAKSINP
jgi:hypothetical protein